MEDEIKGTEGEDEGKAGTEAEEGAESAAVSGTEQEAAGEALTEAEAIDEDKVDEAGVPWKNRFKESERKRLDSERKRLDLLEKMANAGKPEKEVEVEDEGDELQKESRRIARDEMLKMQRFEAKAADVLDEVMDELSTQNAKVRTIERDIRKAVSYLTPQQKCDPNVVKRIAFMSWGEKNISSSASRPKEVKKLVSGSAANAGVLPPASKSKKSSGLSPEMEDFADRLELRDKDFTDDDIRELYDKRHKKGG